MLIGLGLIVLAYLLGSFPVAHFVARSTRGIDLRDVGSGNAGASNIWQNVGRWLVVPVGVAQIAQGLAVVMLARLAGQGDGVQALCGIASVVANDWSPWLSFTGGRGIGQTIGVMLGLSWQSLGVFTVVSLVGVAVGWIPQFVALALFAAPFGEIVTGGSAAAAWGGLALAVIAMIKRILGNARPDVAQRRLDVWLNRFVYDRDVRERDAWVKRRPSRVTDR